MNELAFCFSCRGFVPSSSEECPHCGARKRETPGALRSWIALAGLGMAAVSLMACYGLPVVPCELPDGGDGGYEACHPYNEADGGDAGADGGHLDGG
jgi:hypothetical protein